MRAATRIGAVLWLALLIAGVASFRWCVEYGWGPSWWTLEEARFRVGWFYAGDPRVKTKTQGWGIQATAPNPRWEQQLPSWRFSGPPFAYINLPLWPPFLVLGAAVGLGWMRSRRGGVDVCTQCRYDLSGTPRGEDGARLCPECGARMT